MQKLCKAIMAKIVRYYSRGRHPKGFWGNRVLKAMNGKQHAALPEWVFPEIQLEKNCRVLDVGCGGGANIARLLEKCPECHVTGLDISTLAVEVSTELNYRAFKDGFCLIVGGNALQMPLAREIFDLVTAFETIYYWASLDYGFLEMFRVLKPGGTLLIANERDGLLPEDEVLYKAVGTMRIYHPEEIVQSLEEAGFINIQTRNDEKRHFICFTATKPK